MRLPALVSFAILALAAACSSETTTSSNAAAPDASSVDPGEGVTPVDPGTDEETTDGGDTTSTKKDAGSKSDGSTQGNPPGDILGTLTGSCGIVKTLLTTKSPSYEKNTLTFVTGETYDKTSLSDDGDRMFDTANAGGSSGESEVMSFEVLHACEGATLVKTETEILYSPPDDAGPSSITDYLASIGGTKIGVSVTRVYKPANQTLTDNDVKALLEKKLEGVNRSSVRVLPADKWAKQILHVWTANQAGTDAVTRVLPNISATLKADTIVLVTQSKGGGFIYCNPDPALGSECP